ncbi:HAD family hydrolase [Myceligenerans pegani]|uniref:HAD family phosphatase n=1 Tax=Myceligenerans pegani TaxID=2776917 RepID=A0ABR9N0I1_9MICO|nr:HAD family phosphatase [Myceligenerans sp. TRM 65318]MBE1877167.1 HAD family phosphatase [Myceligenerans sp. TRM 65318]MBE3019438.1 HAD family phosphatase [Myceligenerans sp. TRM 65318]
MTDRLMYEISPAELIDRIAIETLIATRHPDQETQSEALRRLELLHPLEGTVVGSMAQSQRPVLDAFVAALQATNRRLWLAESRLRELDWSADGKREYFTLSRSLFLTNVRRSAIKNKIDMLLGIKGSRKKHYDAGAPTAGNAPILSAPHFAILFDLDGVLVDTEPLKARAHALVAEDIGIKGTTDFSELVGQSLSSIAGQIMSESGRAQSSDDYVKRFHARYAELLSETVPPIAGGPEVISHLRHSSILVGVVTSSTAFECETALRSARYEPSEFDVLISADDVGRAKPDPAPYLAGMEALLVKPRDCIVVEDSISGVTAALAAGARKVFHLQGNSAGSERLECLDDIPKMPFVRNVPLLDIP